MFTWICPQCGAEVPPSSADCPRCAERAKAPPPPPPPAQAAAPPPPPPPPPQQQHYAQPQYAPPPQYPPPQYQYGPPPRKGPPGWLVTLGVTLGMLGGGYLLYGYLGKRDAAREVASQAPEPAPAVAFEKPAEAKAEPSGGAVDVAKHIEVTGIRIVEEKKKPWIRAMIVNHSSADLTDVKGTLVLMTKDGQKTVATLPVTIPDLLQYEAKEVAGPLVTKMRAYELPDWQFLRAELDMKKR